MPPSRSRRSLEDFGFNNAKRHMAIYQFRDLLKLNATQFKETKEQFNRTTLRHMDIKKTGTSQKEAIQMAVKDVKSKLPILFKEGDIEQRLCFAERVILVIHNDRRKKWLNEIRKQNPPSSTKPRPSLAERMAANLQSIINGKAPAPKIFASPAPQQVRFFPSLSEIPSRSLARQHSSTRPSQTNPTVDTNILSSSLPGPGWPEAQVSSFSTPTTSSNNVMAGPSASISCEDTRGCRPSLHTGRIRSVHKFLETASPPMTHLLHRLIDFGCLGEDSLFVISMWPIERIRAFLRNLPPGPGGKAMNGMEVEVLGHQFESYFLRYNSAA